jgi:hypothetical protein
MAGYRYTCYLYNSGDLPVKIDSFITYSSKGEERESIIPIIIAPGEYI